jgi:uncharacterized protein (DUF1800 family)
MRLKKASFVRDSIRQTTAALTLAAVLAIPFAAEAQQKMSKPVAQTNTATAAKKLTEDQKILHVLSRLGFGARPGDVERVRQIGLEKYIEQQLNASAIDDSAVTAKLQNFEALKMSNAELFAKYPNQAAVLQAVAQQSGVSVQQLRQAEIRGNGRANDGKSKAERQAGISDEMPAMKNGNATPAQQEGLSADERRKLQQQAIQLYRELGLRRPNEINNQLIASRILRATYSERQLQEVMVDFWTNHFNVFAGKGATRWFLPEYDRDVIRPNALGNFRDLVAATAKSPAMLFYLDNFESVTPNANQSQNRRMERLMRNGGQLGERAKERLRERGLSEEQIEQRVKQMQNQARRQRGINENYARELMELHTLGVDGGYTQKDIQEVARAFTGWTINDPRGYRKSVAKLGMENQSRAMNGLARLGGVPEDVESGEFYFNERLHDKGEKIVLGQKINAGGMNDGLQVIDVLVKHPSTAKFIARKLAVKFVSDNPSDALVSRVAEAFQKSNGDIKTTLRALFTAPEFFAPENYRAKIKTPFEVVVSSIRTLGADTNASPQLQGLLAKMGEPLYGYQAPTGYPDTAEDWVNTGALLERLNFGLALASNRIPGTRVDLTKYVGKDADDKEKVMNTFISVVLQNEVSPNTKATLMKQLNQPLPEPKLTAEASDDEAVMENASLPRQRRGGANAANRLLPATGNAEVVKILGLVLGSPEFQRQ